MINFFPLHLNSRVKLAYWGSLMPHGPSRVFTQPCSLEMKRRYAPIDSFLPPPTPMPPFTSRALPDRFWHQDGGVDPLMNHPQMLPWKLSWCHFWNLISRLARGSVKSGWSRSRGLWFHSREALSYPQGSDSTAVWSHSLASANTRSLRNQIKCLLASLWHQHQSRASNVCGKKSKPCPARPSRSPVNEKPSDICLHRRYAYWVRAGFIHHFLQLLPHSLHLLIFLDQNLQLLGRKKGTKADCPGLSLDLNRAICLLITFLALQHWPAKACFFITKTN